MRVSQQVGILWCFFFSGAIYSNLAVVIPLIKALHGLSNASLGGFLAIAIIGGIASFPCTSAVGKVMSNKYPIILASLGAFACFVLAGIRGHLIIFGIAIFTLGFCLGYIDILANVEAVAYESTSGEQWLGYFNSWYSAGEICGALIGSGFVASGYSALEEACLYAMIFILPAIALPLFGLLDIKAMHPENGSEFKLTINDGAKCSADVELSSSIANHATVPKHKDSDSCLELEQASVEEIEQDEEESLLRARTEDERLDVSKEGGGSAQNAGIVDYSLLSKLGILMFITNFASGSVYDWTAVYIRDELGGSTLSSSACLTIFQVVFVPARLAVDRLAPRFGKRHILMVSGCICVLGLCMISIAARGGVAVAIVGFAIFGAGLSAFYIFIISLAGHNVRGMDPVDAIGTVTVVGYTGLLAGPPILGGVSELVGSLSWSFLLEAALMASSVLVVLSLDPSIDSDIDFDIDSASQQHSDGKVAAASMATEGRKPASVPVRGFRKSCHESGISCVTGVSNSNDILCNTTADIVSVKKESSSSKNEEKVEMVENPVMSGAVRQYEAVS